MCAQRSHQPSKVRIHRVLPVSTANITQQRSNFMGFTHISMRTPLDNLYAHS